MNPYILNDQYQYIFPTYWEHLYEKWRIEIYIVVLSQLFSFYAEYLNLS